jgi:hypothetical protein
MNVGWARHDRLAALFSVILIVLASNINPLSAADVPRFRDYAAARSHYGSPAPIKLAKQDMVFRSRLRAAVKKQPNFAGNFVLETWGCGTSCLMGAAIDVATGKVVRIPFSICCATPADSKFNAIEFRPDSRLIIFAGLRNEEKPMGAHYYQFDGHEFRFLMTVPDDGTFATNGRATELAGSSSARPQGADPTLGEPAFKVLPEWCQHGDCFTSTIEEISPIAFAEPGVLFKIISQEWEARISDRSKRRFNQTTTVYVFCSKQTPAFIDSSDKGFRATFLAPDKEGNYGHANEIAYWFYFAVCHGKLFDSLSQPSTYARQLGYDVEAIETQPLFKRPEAPGQRKIATNFRPSSFVAPW